MNIFRMPVHPAAAIFPMLSEDELSELAADIKANGLLQPLVVKADVLIDGRNRREACKRAGIEPLIQELDGIDPVAYILASNITRRHLTKGQRAMAVAKLYPEPKQGRKDTSLKNNEVSGGYVRQARTVLQWVPELADRVLAGTTPLNDAYAEAQRLKDQADAEPKRLEKLRARAADLADLVDEGRMSLLEAESAHETRLGEERRLRQAFVLTIGEMERLLDYFADQKRRAHVAHVLSDATDEKRRVRGLLKQWIKNLSDTLEAL